MRSESLLDFLSDEEYKKLGCGVSEKLSEWERKEVVIRER